MELYTHTHTVGGSCLVEKSIVINFLLLAKIILPAKFATAYYLDGLYFAQVEIN